MTEKLSAFDAAMDKWQEAVDQRETAIDTLSTLIKYLKTNCDIDHENDPESFQKMMEHLAEEPKWTDGEYPISEII